MSVKRLQKLLRKSWSAKTSFNPEGWTPKNPAFGQCAVTALIVQDFFNGTILKVKGAKGTHFWNMFPDRREVDFSAGQFRTGTERPSGPIKIVSRSSLLRIENVRKRYDLLKIAVNEAIRKEVSLK